MRQIPNYELFSPTHVFFDTFCASRGVTKTAFAKGCGISPSTLTYLLQNKMDLSMEKILVISELFEIEPDILIRLKFINETIDNIINAYPELSKYQKYLYKIIKSEE